MNVEYNKKVLRGEIYYVDFGDGVGSEEKGVRPAVVIQNEKGNFYSPTIIVSPITTQSKTVIPTHVDLYNNFDNGLKDKSTAMLEQIFTIDKQRLGEKIGSLTEDEMKKIDKALKISLDLN